MVLGTRERLSAWSDAHPYSGSLPALSKMVGSGGGDNRRNLVDRSMQQEAANLALDETHTSDSLRERCPRLASRRPLPMPIIKLS
jgi:hypothetical protein